jgi:hypothetical protein
MVVVVGKKEKEGCSRHLHIRAREMEIMNWMREVIILLALQTVLDEGEGCLRRVLGYKKSSNRGIWRRSRRFGIWEFLFLFPLVEFQGIQRRDLGLGIQAVVVGVSSSCPRRRSVPAL